MPHSSAANNSVPKPVQSEPTVITSGIGKLHSALEGMGSPCTARSDDLIFFYCILPKGSHQAAVASDATGAAATTACP